MNDKKFLEIRDKGTTMSMMAIAISSADGWLAKRVGFGDTRLIILVNLGDMTCSYDPYGWKTRARTVPHAHQWITEHWDELKNEDVVDVQFILGETTAPKTSDKHYVSR